jgi:hypothetical protein
MLYTNSKQIQLQFEGYFNTPLLWNSTSIFGLKQLELPVTKPTPFNGEIPKNLRLGKLVEHFVAHELSQQNNIEILAQNNQIQQEKTTLGELDFIIKKEQTPIHLEVVYKFYLYDKSVGNQEIEHWIGPNRNDNLVNKLSKLKEKQLPLLKNSCTSTLLQKLKLPLTTIKQYVYFKAQLFVPLQLKNKTFQFINNNCIKGFYVHEYEINSFQNCKFYIPTKVNWLQEIQTHINWIKFEDFYIQIETILKQQTAPLCWLKYPNGQTEKFFIVWW